MLTKCLTKDASKRLAVYIMALWLALWAVVWDIRVMDYLDIMAEQTSSALKLTAVAAVEDMESQLVESQAAYDESQAQDLSSKAKRYYYLSKVDEVYAERARKRGEYYAKIAKEEQLDADQLRERARHDDELRLAIIKNISTDQKEQEELVDELRKVNSGVCEFKLIGWLCDVVGGAGDLQRKADEDYVKIQRDWAEKEKVSRQEFLENMVATALQAKATEYNNTATELLQIAEQWEMRSQTDFQYGGQYNESAKELHEYADRLENRGEQDKVYEDKNLSLAEKSFADAESAYRSAILLCFLASAEAIVALSYFLPRSTLKMALVCHVVKDWSSRSSSQEMWRCVSYCVLHLLVFFLTIGMCRDYIGYLNKYGWAERSAIVAWFSFLAAWIQTMALHVFPHATAEWPLSRQDTINVAKNAALRFMLLLALFCIEFLFIWINLAPLLLADTVTDFFGHPIVCLLGFLLLLLHVYVFEPRYPSHEDAHSHSTLSSDEDTQFTHSEATPLTSTAEAYHKSHTSPGSTVVALLTMDLGVAGRGETVGSELETQYSLDSTSPYHVRVTSELLLLLFAFEILIDSCMIGVLYDCLPLAYHSSAGRVILSLLLLMLLVLTIGMACFGRSAMHYMSLERVKSPEERHIEIVSV